MGLWPLEFTDCLTDSPYFRENLHAHEKELERTSQSIKVLIRDVKDLIAAAKNLSRAQRNLGHFFQTFNFESIGNRLTDDEIVIAGSLKEFGNLLMSIEDERDRMLERAQVTFIDPIEKFRKEHIGGAKEWKKKFEKDTTKFCQSLERHLNLSTRKSENHLQDADASLEMEQRHFFQSSLHYIFLLQEVHERKKFEFVETILTFMYGWLTFYHQGHEVARDFKSFMTDLQIRLQRTRDSFYSTHAQTAQLKDKMLEVRTDNRLDPGSFNKMYARQGYLFVMEKKALVTQWNKVFCMYKKDGRVLTMIPYTQTAGKITSSETIMLKESVKRTSLDKRFCFEVISADKSYTFQALSEEDLKLWLDALGGIEMNTDFPRSPNGGIRGDECLLDEKGFGFVRWCISVVETHGLNDQGLYRLVGVSSKVAKLTQMVMETGNQLNPEKLEILEIKTITSALKNYFRNLPQPLMTYRLHTAFIEAAKLENKSLRIEHIHSLVHNLPKPNYDMLELLIRHLFKVAQHSEKNKMGVSNLGVCFGPTLLRSEIESVAAIIDIKFGNVVIEILIENCDLIFGSRPPDALLSDTRRSRLYSTYSPLTGSREQANPQHSFSPTHQPPDHRKPAPITPRVLVPSYSQAYVRPGPPHYPSTVPMQKYQAGERRGVYNPTWPECVSSSSSSEESVEVPIMEDELPDKLTYSQGGLTMRTIYACMGENESELSFEPNQIIHNGKK